MAEKRETLLKTLRIRKISLQGSHDKRLMMH